MPLRSVIQQCLSIPADVNRRRCFSSSSSPSANSRGLTVARMVFGPMLKRGAQLGLGYGIASLLHGATAAEHFERNEKLAKALSKLPGKIPR